MSRERDFDFFTTVDDEMYDDLSSLTGQKVVYAELWDESLQDTLNGATTDPATQVAVDLDLYLDGGVYFELYGVVSYRDLTADPLVGFAAIQQHITQLIKQELWLDEVAVDEEDSLILILAQHHRPQLYLQIDGWSVAEWDELPAG